MAATKTQKRHLEDFCIDGFFLFVEKSNHLNSQVAGEAAQFGLQREIFFQTDLQAHEFQTTDQLTDFIYRAFLSKVADIFVISSCSL